MAITGLMLKRSCYCFDIKAFSTSKLHALITFHFQDQGLEAEMAVIHRKWFGDGQDCHANLKCILQKPCPIEEPVSDDVGMHAEWPVDEEDSSAIPSQPHAQQTVAYRSLYTSIYCRK